MFEPLFGNLWFFCASFDAKNDFFSLLCSNCQNKMPLHVAGSGMHAHRLFSFSSLNVSLNIKDSIYFFEIGKNLLYATPQIDPILIRPNRSSCTGIQIDIDSNWLFSSKTICVFVLSSLVLFGWFEKSVFIKLCKWVFSTCHTLHVLFQVFFPLLLLFLYLLILLISCRFYLELVAASAAICIMQTAESYCLNAYIMLCFCYRSNKIKSSLFSSKNVCVFKMN